jgi:galactokinase/mevalonate kinase-like predicted kinase
MIRATAPGRCGIAGNPSDMYGGSVISISTIERACCELSNANVLTIRADDEEAEIHDESALELRGNKLDILRAAIRYFDIPITSNAITLSISTEIPMQAGMAGSTALMVAVIGALNAYYDWKMNPWIIAETARKVENQIMGILCGHQDQHMAVFGGINFMDFAGKEKLEQSDDEPLAVIEPLHSYIPSIPLLCAHTGLKHNSGTVHRSPRERWLAGEPEVVLAFKDIASLAREGKKALLAADWAKLGALMNENHRIISGMGGSGPVNDRLIQAARDTGAYGAKLAGAGGGGTILVLTDQPDIVGGALMNAGADRLMFPAACPGLLVEIL